MLRSTLARILLYLFTALLKLLETSLKMWAYYPQLEVCMQT